ncbi:MAG: hypothetical protein GXZ11_02345 [Tissierellia bacterium]|nr:hypothetical protein [Tissierellia bacterium]
MNKKILWLVVLVAFGTLLMAGCQKGPEGVVAEVNGEQITREKFDAEYSYMRNYTAKQNGEAFLDQLDQDGIAHKYQLAKNVLKSLEDRTAILQDAKAIGVEVTDEAIAAELEKLKAQINGESETDTAYQEYLTSNGMDETFLTENIRLQLLMKEYERVKMEKMTIDAKEIENYYNEHKEELVQVETGGILVKTKEEADAVKAKLDEGADFAETAKEFSIDQVTAANGGSFGYSYRGMFSAEIEEVVFGLKVGEYSEPTESENGYYILAALNRKESLEDVKDVVETIIKRQNFQDEMQKLVKDAKIKEYLDYKTVE